MQGEELGERANFEQALRMLRRQWKVILLCTLIVAGAAVGFSSVQQKKYTASSSLLFSQEQFDQALFGSNFTPPVTDPQQEQATNIDLVSLPIVATRTAAALHLSRKVVTSEVAVSQVGQANLAQISVTDPSPVRAAKIANAYANQYVLFRQEADRAKVAAARKLVQQQLARLTPRERSGAVGQELLNRANELGVLAALQTGNAEVVQPAGVPRSPSSPHPVRNGALGALVGLLLGLAFAFVAERLDRRVREPVELERLYDVPLLASVPRSRALAADRLDSLPATDVEAFSLLRARLRYFNVDRNIRSLLVTSGISGEGKTTVTLNLAIAECLTGNRKALVLEADLRRPSLAKRLGLGMGPGLSEVLTGNATLEETLTWVDLPETVHGNRPGIGFTVLPAGASPPNPVELLSSRTLIQLLDSLTERFELVIIDTSPVTLVSDAIPLVNHVDGVLVVARMEHTTKSSARHAAHQLANLRAPILGVVGNAIAPRDRANYLGYGPGYYGYEYSNGRRSARETAVEIPEPAVQLESEQTPTAAGSSD